MTTIRELVAAKGGAESTAALRALEHKAEAQTPAQKRTARRSRQRFNARERRRQSDREWLAWIEGGQK